MKFALASLLLFAAAGPAVTPAPYRFDEVKRTVTLRSASGEVAATKGLGAQGGDRIHTGWFSFARIASDPYKARFEIYSSTDVTLAPGNTPGVILSLDRGKLHAIFDKLTGTEPRVVQTPGALLAVRGTEYTVEVAQTGETTLDVLEGIVEVRSPLTPAPMLIHPGQSSTFSRRTPPDMHVTPRNPRGDEPHGEERNRGGEPHGGGHPPQPHPGSTTPPPPKP